MSLSLRNVRKSYGQIVALDGFSLDAEHGEAIVLLGPSGCGKTTTLRLLAGFEVPDSGRIEVGGSCMADDEGFVPPEKRPVSVVFQNYALWPHMTVADNVGFGPSLDGGRRSRRDVARRVRETLELVQLGHVAERYPHQLSGGQQQRIALARALITEPATLLLDEPLSNLDTRLREEMRFEISRLRRRLGFTMLYVTHDQTEALSLADRIAVMHGGTIVQLGSPEELYRRPNTPFVATALGATNLLPGHVVDAASQTAHVRVLGATVLEAAVPGELNPRPGDEVLVSVRPCDIVLARFDTATDPALAGVICDSLFFGESIQHEVAVEGSEVRVKVTSAGTSPLRSGDRVALDITPGMPSLLTNDVTASPVLPEAVPA